MWTLHLRWKIIYQWFICSWRDHDTEQFHAISVWHSNEYFCKRCLLRRPSWRTVKEEHRDGSGIRWREDLDWDGNVIGRHQMGTWGRRSPVS